MAELDLPALAVAFGREVRDAGIPTTPDRTLRFARALTLAPPAGRDALYWTARAIFVSAREQIVLFDAVFGRTFDGLLDVACARGDQNAPVIATGARTAPRPPSPDARSLQAQEAGGGSAPGAAVRAQDPGEGPEREVSVAAASELERLADRDFAELDGAELAAVRRMMAELALAVPTRLSRRSRRDRHGERLDLRATLRASRRTGGDPARVLRRRRRRVPRRLVVLCDISGSMEAYSRAFLQFLHSATAAADAEAFVFATRLTRLTRALRGRNPDLALARASAAAPDWSGGTRIGEALAHFNDGYGRRGMAHGAVIVILSDGWERGDPALLAREMERLRRLAHRIVWVNPRKAAPGFEPLAGGMAAALPSCDAFLAGNSLRALAAVADAIAGAR
jgi:uncharacterized protein